MVFVGLFFGVLALSTTLAQDDSAGCMPEPSARTCADMKLGIPPDIHGNDVFSVTSTPNVWYPVLISTNLECIMEQVFKGEFERDDFAMYFYSDYDVEFRSGNKSLFMECTPGNYSTSVPILVEGSCIVDETRTEGDVDVTVVAPWYQLLLARKWNRLVVATCLTDSDTYLSWMVLSKLPHLGAYLCETLEMVKGEGLTLTDAQAAVLGSCPVPAYK